MGQTITTDTKTASIIVAVLAVLTTLGMGHLWNLITFVFHQIRADGRPSEGVFRQQQALLRTLPTPSSFVTDSLKLVFKWKGIASKKVLGYSMMQISVALFFAIGSLAASIFSSYAVSGSNLVVLVKSPFCGLMTGVTYSGYNSQVMDISNRYARECYRDGKIVPARCNIFMNPKLDFTMEDAECPFPGQCKGRGVALDSGMIDVIEAFGLNSPKENGVKYRTRKTCGVLSMENRTSVVKATDLPPHLLRWAPLPQEEYLVAHLGNRKEDTAWANATFGFSLTQSNLTNNFFLG